MSKIDKLARLIWHTVVVESGGKTPLDAWPTIGEQGHKLWRAVAIECLKEQTE